MVYSIEHYHIHNTLISVKLSRFGDSPSLEIYGSLKVDVANNIIKSGYVVQHSSAHTWIRSITAPGVGRSENVPLHRGRDSMLDMGGGGGGVAGWILIFGDNF